MLNLYDQFNREWFQNCCTKYGATCAPIYHQYISNHSDLTWEIVKENLNFPWDWHAISFNKNINWNIVQSNPKFPWKYYAMTANPNITMEIIQANPDKPWNKKYIETRYNYSPLIYSITTDIAYTRVLNDFLRIENEKKTFMQDKFREWFKSSELRFELMSIVMHPDNLEYFEELGFYVSL